MKYQLCSKAETAGKEMYFGRGDRDLLSSNAAVTQALCAGSDQEANGTLSLTL